MVSNSTTRRQSGEFIKRLRKELKLSQEKTAQYAKVSPVTLRNYENGKTIPNASTAERIEITLKYLYLVTKKLSTVDLLDYEILSTFSEDFKKSSGRERLDLIDELNLIFDSYADVSLLMDGYSKSAEITTDSNVKSNSNYSITSFSPEEIRLVYLFRQLSDQDKVYTLKDIGYKVHKKHIYEPTDEEWDEIHALYGFDENEPTDEEKEYIRKLFESEDE